MIPSEPGTHDSQHDRAKLQQSPATILAQLSESWWDDLRQLLELETGMELSGSRNSRLREAVTNVVRKHRLSPSLLNDKSEHGRFLEHVAAELTVGESFFLRNEHHMQILQEEILPRIQKENQARREIRIWSAGCAAGEEPYSLAILLDQIELFREWQISILATDLNPSFLEKARVGQYRAWSFRMSEVHYDSRFFTRTGEGYQIKDHLRKHVRFHYLNLVKDVYPSGLNGTLGLDLILFRNVAIYLKQDVTTAILQRMFRALRPGGWLLLGEIEVTLAPQIGLETHRFENVTIHRKPVDAFPVMDWAFPISPPSHVPGTSNPQSAQPSSNLAASPSEVAVPSVGVASEELASIHPPAQGQSQADGFNSSSRPLPAAEQMPSSDSGHLQQARTCLHLAQTEQAREQLKKSLQKDPLCIEAYLLLGGLEEDAGELQRAEHSYRRALYLDRDCPLIHFHLGLVLRQMGDHRRGRQCLKTALLLAESHAPEELVRHGDGVCYGRLQEMVLMLAGDDNG